MKRLKGLPGVVSRKTIWSRKNSRCGRPGPLPPESPREGHSFDCCDLIYEPDGAVLNSRSFDWEVSSIGSTDESCEDGYSLDSSYHSHVNDGPLNTHSKIFPGCPLTVKESVTLVLALKAKHNLTRTCVNGILQLIKLHLPACTTFPDTEVKAENEVQNFNEEYKEDYFYCQDCVEVLDPSMQCPVCKKYFVKDRRMCNNNMFTVYNIRNQLTNLLEIESVAKEVQSMLEQRSDQPQFIRKQHSKIPIKNYDLTLCLNTDGVPVFNSSKTAIWPVLLAVNELPMHLKSRYVLLGALWVGKGKIIPDLVFPKIVKQLNYLQKEPIKWQLLNKTSVLSHVYVVSVAVDAPARCLVQGHTQFNGEFGCNWCQHQGEVVPKGKGYARVYTLNECNLRTAEAYKNQVMTRNFTMGIQTASPLLLLRNFDIVKGLSVDYMHCALLGVGRTFLTILIKSSAQPYCIGKSLDIIDQRWMSIRVPDELPRPPRSLNERKYWKASEFKTWIFSLHIILSGILPESYLVHHNKLASALPKMLSTELTVSELQSCSELFTEYVQGVETLYGKEFCTFNVHQLTHIVNCVEELGFLWENSAFVFENFNGILKKCVKGSNGVLAQISKKFVRNFVLAKDYESCQTEEVKQFISGNLLTSKSRDKALNIHGPFYPVHGHETIINELRVLHPHISEICTSKKCTVGLRVLKCDKRNRKRVNNVLLLGNNVVGRVISFLKCKYSCEEFCDCKRDFALVEKIDVMTVDSYQYIFRRVSYHAAQIITVDLKHLGAEKLCLAEFEGNEYYIRMPNLIEFE